MSRDRPTIVSSTHLFSEDAAELSEVEYTLTLANNAFGWWYFRGTVAAITKFLIAVDPGVLDVLCLHSVNRRARMKKLADIWFKLNIDETHVVICDLKKLVDALLADGCKQGKAVLYATCEMGRALCFLFRDICEAYLAVAFSAHVGDDSEHLVDPAQQSRVRFRRPVALQIYIWGHVW